MQTHIKSSIYIKDLDNVLDRIEEINYLALIDGVVADHVIHVYKGGFKLTTTFSAKVTNN